MSTAVSLNEEGFRANRCGVPVFALDCWATLDRYLILGVAGGTYYASEGELRLEHLWNLLTALDADGPRAVARIAEISFSGRAPKNDPAIGALAIAASIGLTQPGTGWLVSSDRTGDTPGRAETRRLALAALPRVCRTATHLFLFVRTVKALRGWGPALSKAVARWYTQAPLDTLVLQAIKYEQRKGVSHADLLRLSHPRTQDENRHILFRWMLAGGISAGLRKRLSSEEENSTPSAWFPQIQAAEDLLMINGNGARRIPPKPARTKRPRDESVRLFGVSTALIEEASLLDEAAEDYAAEDFEEEYVAPEAPVQEPPATLFTPDEVADAVRLIKRHSLPHEVVPSHLKKERAIWEALLADMPMTAMLRNLAVMSRVGLLQPFSDEAAYVASRLRDQSALRAARLHPLSILQALETYKAGKARPRNHKGHLQCGGGRGAPRQWDPAQEILEALNEAFHLAFHNVTPSNARLMLGVDVSGSMEMEFIGDSWLSARSAAAAMCLVTARTEARWQAYGFTSGEYDFGHFWSGGKPNVRRAPSEVYPGLTRLPLDKHMSVADAAEAAGRLPMGSTDCALLIRYALKKEIEVDAFVTYTDNEHNTGPMTPAQALAKYRAASGIPARLICVGMTATDYSIADPKDPLNLNVVGFDAAAPSLIADFAGGRL